jgi:hypothetical protein
MTEENAGPAPADGEAAKAARKARSERLNRIMWAYICGAIALLSFVVGFGGSFIPLGFGVLGCVLVGQLIRQGERRHSAAAGALALAGIMIWLTVNWPMIQHQFGG